MFYFITAQLMVKSLVTVATCVLVSRVMWHAHIMFVLRQQKTYVPFYHVVVHPSTGQYVPIMEEHYQMYFLLSKLIKYIPNNINVIFIVALVTLLINKLVGLVLRILILVIPPLVPLTLNVSLIVMCVCQRMILLYNIVPNTDVVRKDYYSMGMSLWYGYETVVWV